MPSSEESIADPALRDLAWTGYHPRALLPAVALAAVVSLVVWTGRYYLEDLSDLADRVGSLALFALGWAVWPALAAIFLYRTVTFTYRLTNRALLVDFGFLASPVPPIPLDQVTAVAIGGGWVLRRLGVGWIEVRTAERSIRLRGLRNPQLFAVSIRDAMSKMKEAK
jgi:membrane protein YdbS with pleckstrin-like domain